MRAFVIFAPWFLLLGSCGAPPKPPVVDESLKRPANEAQAVELQSCKSQLHNAKVESRTAERRLDAEAAARNQLLLQYRALGSLSPPQVRPAEPNSVFTIRFEFGSTQVVVSDAQSAALLAEAKSAPLIVVRGRTDGTQDSIAESRIARERAAAIRDHLVEAGVDPSRIRATYQPVGDHVAENATAGGRALNRRAEVEVYRNLPRHQTAPTANGQQ